MMISENMRTQAQQVIEICKSHGHTLTTAESCTGGLISAALTAIAGASDVYDRGFVTYSNPAKSDLLGVPADLIETQGAVSEQVSRAMAEGALVQAKTSIAVAVTGIAGPGGGTQDKPVGLVHIACARHEHQTLHQKHLFGELSRDQIREATVIAALAIIMQQIPAPDLA